MPVDTTARSRAPGLSLGHVHEMARAAAFWLAVALPIAYVPAVLLAPATAVDPGVLTVAVAGNLFALLVGHGHEPRRDRPVAPRARRAPSGRHSHGCPPAESGHSGYQ